MIALFPKLKRFILDYPGVVIIILSSSLFIMTLLYYLLCNKTCTQDIAIPDYSIFIIFFIATLTGIIITIIQLRIKSKKYDVRINRLQVRYEKIKKLVSQIQENESVFATFEDQKKKDRRRLIKLYIMVLELQICPDTQYGKIAYSKFSNNRITVLLLR